VTEDLVSQIGTPFLEVLTVSRLPDPPHRGWQGHRALGDVRRPHDLGETGADLRNKVTAALRRRPSEFAAAVLTTSRVLELTEPQATFRSTTSTVLAPSRTGG
jgi:hypothetical protein